MLSGSRQLPACGEYVLGYSTGHVGTTTLSSRTTYADGPTKSVSDVQFFFEIDAHVQAPCSSCSDGNVSSSKKVQGLKVGHHGLTIEEQEDHVRNVYFERLSLLLRARGVSWARTCVDLNHFTLMYFDGLTRVLSQEPAIQACAHPSRRAGDSTLHRAWGASERLLAGGLPTVRRARVARSALG
jgi:hypothetical protein